MSDAAEALRLLLSGRLDEGLAHYRRALKGDRLPDAPIGLHLLFLRQAGQQEAASALLKLGIERGADVSAKAGGFGSTPAEAAREYEGLFAEGIVNSRMVLQYLRTLGELGRFEELRVWLRPSLLLRAIEVGNAELAADVEALIFAEQARAVHQQATQSVRDMWMLKNFTRLDHAAVHALIAELTAQTAAYLADWAASDHPLAKLVPKAFTTEGWALLSKGSGYNIPHVHQEGWATGVYYPVSPSGGGGDLHVGRPEGAKGSDADWGATAISPRRGYLVLMPSFYTHWTVPMERPGIRQSVAFDIVPAHDALVSPAGFEPATY